VIVLSWVAVLMLRSSFFFFFQAEDGIRDRNVTGVQTCALPIFEALGREHASHDAVAALVQGHLDHGLPPVLPEEAGAVGAGRARSEERRVGKEGRGRGWAAGEQGSGRRKTRVSDSG